jgi:hypothetical protein
MAFFIGPEHLTVLEAFRLMAQSVCSGFYILFTQFYIDFKANDLFLQE